MARFAQYMGFTPAAVNILDTTTKIGTKVVVELDLEGHPTKTYTQDLITPSYTKEQYDKNPGVFGNDDEPLFRMTFSDGRVLEEYVQAEPWSSGPCTFMALRDAVTKEPITETLWSQEDIDKA